MPIFEFLIRILPYDALTGVISIVTSIIYNYGYLGILVLMTLESAALPIPSEVVLPLVGVLSARGVLNPYLGILVALISGLIGAAIDYYIAYFLGREFVYKKLGILRIKRSSLDAFDRWFQVHGTFAVFVGRLIPELRGLVSFPAGFAVMPKKRFLFSTMVGTLIWDIALVSFGYYALNTSDITITMVAIALFVIALYLLYRTAMKRIKKN